MTIRILVADDFEGWRRQVGLLLQARSEWQIVCEVSDGAEAVRKAEELQPELILLDIGLPHLNGIEAARRIRQVSPSSKILFLSTDNSRDVVQVAMSTGAQGYVYKARAPNDLLSAIEAVLQGKQFVSSSIKGYKFADVPATKVPHGHELLFFSDDTVLLDGFTRFVAAALRAHNAAIALVTKAHQESLLQRLKAESVDIDGAIQQGSCIFLDVADTLAALMVDGLPDPFRFFEDFSRLIEAVSKAAKAEHPRVAFCGECVGRLWAEGKTDLATRLEQGCNDLTERYAVDLLCAYPSSCVHGGEDEHVFQSIYSVHSAVYSPRIRHEIEANS